jgi:hypothetical protein
MSMSSVRALMVIAENEMSRRTSDAVLRLLLFSGEGNADVGRGGDGRRRDGDDFTVGGEHHVRHQREGAAAAAKSGVVGALEWMMRTNGD